MWKQATLTPHSLALKNMKTKCSVLLDILYLDILLVGLFFYYFFLVVWKLYLWYKLIIFFHWPRDLPPLILHEINANLIYFLWPGGSIVSFFLYRNKGEVTDSQMCCPWCGYNEQAIFLPIGWFQFFHIAALSHAASWADAIDIFLVNCSGTLYCPLPSN